MVIRGDLMGKKTMKFIAWLALISMITGIIASIIFPLL